MRRAGTRTGCVVLMTITCALLSINTWAGNTLVKSALAKNNAVILLYHHVSNSTPKVTSVSPENFRQHMQYLADHHPVLPLKEVMEALQNKQPLPDKTVVITFDDGYKNIFDNAHPILQEFAFPYSVFINPALIGNASYQLDWQQVNIMASQGASFANHGRQHTHMLMKDTDGSTENWLSRSMADIEYAENALIEKLDDSLKYFAYPYGEFDLPLKTRLSALGYIGFAQHSGAIASYSDFSALPRFSAAGVYSNIETLKVKLNSLAMPVTIVVPNDPKVEMPTHNQDLTFSVKTDDLAAQQINCFQNGQILNKSIVGNTISVELQPINQPGRHRVNCTAPSTSEKGRYYWFSQPFFIPTAEGEWLD